MRVVGLKALDRAFAELATATSARTARTALRKGLMKAAEPMASRAREIVGAQSTRTGALRDSIMVSPRLKNEPGKAAYAASKRAGGSDADAVAALRAARRDAKGAQPAMEVYVGPTGAPASRAHFIEFGTSRAKAEPFMRPAYEQAKEQVAQGITDAVGGEIEKALTRARRKAARGKAGA